MLRFRQSALGGGALLLSLLLLGAGNARLEAQNARPAAPALGPARAVAPGVTVREVTLTGREQPIKVWIYLPKAVPSGKKLPCVLIAPAGSRLFHGMTLGDGDRPEHLPYVRAGFAVVAYEIEGPVSQGARGPELVQAAGVFRKAGAGLVDARKALDFALAEVPAIDPKRIYTAGHSSAATLSLLVAEHEPRVAACVAYAPICDLPGRLGPKFVRAFDQEYPGFGRFLVESSPGTHPELLRCPTFLFHADDDSNVPKEEVAGFARRLQQTNRRVKLVEVPTGNHYDSMIRQGIPRAIAWLKALK